MPVRPPSLRSIRRSTAARHQSFTPPRRLIDHRRDHHATRRSRRGSPPLFDRTCPGYADPEAIDRSSDPTHPRSAWASVRGLALAAPRPAGPLALPSVSRNIAAALPGLRRRFPLSLDLLCARPRRPRARGRLRHPLRSGRLERLESRHLRRCRFPVASPLSRATCLARGGSACCIYPHPGRLAALARPAGWSFGPVLDPLDRRFGLVLEASADGQGVALARAGWRARIPAWRLSACSIASCPNIANWRCGRGSRARPDRRFVAWRESFRL